MSDVKSWVLGYLLNSLWQVPVLFAAAWAVSRIARRMGPRVEHRVWVSALVLEAVVPACSFHLMAVLREIWALVRFSSGGTGGVVRVTIGPGVISDAGVLRLPAVVLTGIAVAYGGSLLYFAGRLAWGLWQTGAMQRQAQRVTLMGEAGLSWQRYRSVFRVETAEVASSSRTVGPVTVGIRRGVMLVPPGFLESVSADDLDAVVAHELAHVRRHDFAKNAAYGVMTLPVSYHPVLWLTRSRVAETREMVCDAMAAEAVAGKERYARSLLRLASLLAKGAPVRTLHAIGIFDANIFERRVMNLTEKRVEVRGARRLVMAAACVVLGVATCASAMALRMEVTGQTEVAQGDGPKVLTVKSEIMAGQVLSRNVPVYPVEAKANKDVLNGAVVLDAIIGKDGAIQNLRVKQSLRRDYDTSALDAVKEWKYKPYLLNGNPVAVRTTITVNYSTVP